MSPRDVPIGEIARLSGVKVPTIRYYEDIGSCPRRPARKEIDGCTAGRTFAG